MMKNEKQNNLNITKLMKMTSNTIQPTENSKEKIWNKVLNNTPKQKSVIYVFSKAVGYTFILIFLLGIGTISMNIIPQRDRTTGISNKDFSIGLLSNKTSNDKTYNEVDQTTTETDRSLPSSIDFDKETTAGVVDSQLEEKERAKSKTAVISLDVDELQKNIDSIYSLLEKYDGYTESVNIKQTNAILVIKIPSTDFDTVYSKIRKLGNKVVSEQISIDDKQTELDNIQNTINNLQFQIDELNKKLETEEDETQRKDIQNQITILENQVNSLQKQLNNIVIETSYSTIEISMNLVAKEQDATKTLWIDVKNVLNFWLGVVVNILVGALFVTPIVVVIWIIKVLLKFFLRKR